MESPFRVLLLRNLPGLFVSPSFTFFLESLLEALHVGGMPCDPSANRSNRSKFGAASLQIRGPGAYTKKNACHEQRKEARWQGALGVW